MQFHFAIACFVVLLACCADDQPHLAGPAVDAPRPVGPPAAHGGPSGAGAVEPARPVARIPQPPLGPNFCLGTCNHQAKIVADLQVSFEEAKAAVFTLCRQDACVDGELPDDAARPMLIGERVGFTAMDPEVQADAPTVELLFVSDGLIGVHLELSWPPKPKFGTFDERFRITVRLADGRTRRLVDTKLTYTVETNCGTLCYTALADLRGQPPLDPADDAGVADDADGGS